MERIQKLHKLSLLQIVCMKVGFYKRKVYLNNLEERYWAEKKNGFLLVND